jgi:hypothetical protein
MSGHISGDRSEKVKGLSPQISPENRCAQKISKREGRMLSLHHNLTREENESEIVRIKALLQEDIPASAGKVKPGVATLRIEK